MSDSNYNKDRIRRTDCDREFIIPPVCYPKHPRGWLRVDPCVTEVDPCELTKELRQPDADPIPEEIIENFESFGNDEVNLNCVDHSSTDPEDPGPHLPSCAGDASHPPVGNPVTVDEDEFTVFVRNPTAAQRIEAKALANAMALGSAYQQLSCGCGNEEITLVCPSGDDDIIIAQLGGDGVTERDRFVSEDRDDANAQAHAFAAAQLNCELRNKDPDSHTCESEYGSEIVDGSSSVAAEEVTRVFPYPTDENPDPSLEVIVAGLKQEVMDEVQALLLIRLNCTVSNEMQEFICNPGMITWEDIDADNFEGITVTVGATAYTYDTDLPDIDSLSKSSPVVIDAGELTRSFPSGELTPAQLQEALNEEADVIVKSGGVDTCVYPNPAIEISCLHKAFGEASLQARCDSLEGAARVACYAASLHSDNEVSKLEEGEVKATSAADALTLAYQFALANLRCFYINTPQAAACSPVTFTFNEESEEFEFDWGGWENYCAATERDGEGVAQETDLPLYATDFEDHKVTDVPTVKQDRGGVCASVIPAGDFVSVTPELADLGALSFARGALSCLFTSSGVYRMCFGGDIAAGDEDLGEGTILQPYIDMADPEDDGEPPEFKDPTIRCATEEHCEVLILPDEFVSVTPDLAALMADSFAQGALQCQYHNSPILCFNELDPDSGVCGSDSLYASENVVENFVTGISRDQANALGSALCACISVSLVPGAGVPNTEINCSADLGDVKCCAGLGTGKPDITIPAGILTGDTESEADDTAKLLCPCFDCDLQLTFIEAMGISSNEKLCANYAGFAQDGGGYQQNYSVHLDRDETSGLVTGLTFENNSEGDFIIVKDGALMNGCGHYKGHLICEDGAPKEILIKV